MSAATRMSLRQSQQRVLTPLVPPVEASVRSAPENRTYPRCLATAKNGLAWFLATCSDERLRDLQLALQYAQSAVDLDPGASGHWNTLGVAYYRNERYDDAVTALNKSVERNKSARAIDLFFLAMAHWQLRDYEKARSWFDEAARRMEEESPSNTELIRFREEATELFGNAESTSSNSPGR